ncbi:MAG: AgmX/PglI C-terminal domain-containing protein, partial [Myxococcota bacterium]
DIIARATLGGHYRSGESARLHIGAARFDIRATARFDIDAIARFGNAQPQRQLGYSYLGRVGHDSIGGQPVFVGLVIGPLNGAIVGVSHRVWAGILFGIIAGNAVGLGLYMTFKAPQAKEAPKSERASTNDAIDQASKERRLAGLDAIERGDHETAIREFSAGLKFSNPAPDLPQLLSIAQNMRAREVERQKEEASAAAQAAEAAAEPPPPPARPGLVLVTTRPARIAIEIDGTVRDISPARIEVEPGAHTVVLVDGGENIFQKSVRVAAGEVALVDVDLTEELAQRALAESARAETEPDPSEPEDESDVPSSEFDAPAQVEPERRRATRDESTESAARLGTFPYPTPSPAAATDTAAKEAARAPTPPPAASPPPPVPPPAVEAIPSKAIRRAVARSQPAFKKCYDRFRRIRPRLAGRAVLEVKVLASGRVEEGRTKESTMEGSGINECLERATRWMRFPSPRGGPTVVSFALRFEANQR